jgi:hypothetical protein
MPPKTIDLDVGWPGWPGCDQTISGTNGTDGTNLSDKFLIISGRFIIDIYIYVFVYIYICIYTACRKNTKKACSGPWMI